MDLDSLRTDVDYAVRQLNYCLNTIGAQGRLDVAVACAKDSAQRALDALERAQTALAVSNEAELTARMKRLSDDWLAGNS